MRNNWERKRPSGETVPQAILKRERQLSSLWAKVRRLATEIARQVSSQIVWLCEAHGVRTLCMEDLRSYQPTPGRQALSWSLSSNLWAKVLDTTRYMRQALGHPHGGGIWTVSPAGTSRRCHACGERGIRTSDLQSTHEVRGGEYFYCPSCGTHTHADINAARNLSMSSVAPGRTLLASH